jgi:glycosyltransferase involved in cell wall biosynthesis
MSNLLVLGAYGDITGGVSTVLSSVVPRLKDNFDNVLVIAPRRRRRVYKDFVDGNLRVVYQPCGTVPYVKVSQPFIEAVRLWRRIRRELRTFKPDITWSNTEATETAARLAGVEKRVRTVHGLPREAMAAEKEVINVVEWESSMWLLTSLEREGLRHVSAITTYSNYLKNKIESSYNPRAPIYVIPNGIDPSLFHPLNLERQNVITYVGRFALVKGVHNLLHAMKIVHKNYPNWKLWLVGDTFDQSMDYFTSIYNKNIVWMGHVPHKDISTILNQSKIFVMPTWRDGFEIALMEAVASGVPSITTGAYERKEIYKDLVTFCSLNDPYDLAEKIVFLIENWDNQFKKAQKASEIARKEFSWESIAKQYLEVFQNVFKD